MRPLARPWRPRRWERAALGVLAAALLLIGLVVWLNVRGEQPVSHDMPMTAPSAADIERGAYLARAGNCIGCHTAAGGAALAGGRGVQTPFGTVYASNLTPDGATGLGRWSASEFWRALHHGRSKDGRLLYPAFPYPSFTQVTRGCAACPRSPSRTGRMPCASPTAPRPRWPSGAPCSSSLASSSPMPRNPPNGTAASTWCKAWATAPPAIRAAMHWAASG
jgi:mono/diheme cytochrome c family protein